MRSGDKELDRSEEWLRLNYEDLSDDKFAKGIFKTINALELIERPNNNKICTAYHGGRYDKGKYKLVKEMWDHEHCSICYYTILPGYSYWVSANKKEFLCDECHDFYIHK
jgi:hypothetical protein